MIQNSNLCIQNLHQNPDKGFIAEQQNHEHGPSRSAQFVPITIPDYTYYNTIYTVI